MAVTPDDRPRPRAAWALARLAAPLAVGGAFVHAASVSWLKWGNLLVDGGRELDVPRRLLEGGHLFVDVRYPYGPLAPWINMALYGVFGVRAGVLQAAGLTIAAAATSLLYLLARRFTGRLRAAAIAITFVYGFAFSHLYEGNAAFNFVLPYSCAATYGLTLALASLLFLVRHAQEGRRSDFGLSAAFLALTALSKPEVLLAAASAHAVFLFAQWRTRRLVRGLLLLDVGAALLAALVWGALALRNPALLGENFTNLAAGAAGFSARLAGLDDVPGALRAMAASAAALGGAAILSLAAGRLLARLGSSPRWVGPAVGALGGAAVAAVYAHLEPTVPFRVLPLLAFAALVWLSVTLVRRPENRATVLPRLLTWSFAFALLVRVPLRAIPQHYGFFLLPAAVLCLGVLMSEDLPRRLPEGSPRAGATLGALGLFAGSLILYAPPSLRAWSEHHAEIAAPRGTFVLRDLGYEAQAVGLLSQLPPRSSVAAIPHGAGYVFASGMVVDGGLDSYMPWELNGRWAEESVIRRWRARRPDAILYLQLELPGFDAGLFGSDYARDLMAFIRANYVVARELNPSVLLLVPRTTNG